VVCLFLALTGCGTRTELWGDVSIAPLELDCPTSLDDPRLPLFFAGRPGTLDAVAFVVGTPTHYKWSVVERDCDAIATLARYELLNAQDAVVQFTPGRPAPYQLRLVVGDAAQRTQSCEFEVPVQGQGMRVELCWRDDTSVDLDLFLHSPYSRAPFLEFLPTISEFGRETVELLPNADSCNVYNCATHMRGGQPRVDFGYPESSPEVCLAGPDPQQFLASGICPNPRSATDTNTLAPSSEGTRGLAEIIHLDEAQEGDTFRVMVHNFNNRPAYLRLFVYCNGVRTAFEPPAFPVNFVAENPGTRGVMWRPFDMVARYDSSSRLGCALLGVEHPELPGQPYLTINDASY